MYTFTYKTNTIRTKSEKGKETIELTGKCQNLGRLSYLRERKEKQKLGIGRNQPAKTDFPYNVTNDWRHQDDVTRDQFANDRIASEAAPVFLSGIPFCSACCDSRFLLVPFRISARYLSGDSWRADDS